MEEAERIAVKQNKAAAIQCNNYLRMDITLHSTNFLEISTKNSSRL